MSLRPLVDSEGQSPVLPDDQALDALAVGTGLELVNYTGSTIPRYSPVTAGYGAGVGGMTRARANSIGLAYVTGFLTTDCAPGASALVQRSGILWGSAAFWAQVTGNPVGLLAGQLYYLSADFPGRISTVLPVRFGEFVVEVGRAISPTQLLINITDPIGL